MENFHKHSNLKTTVLLSHSSGNQKSKIGPKGWVPPEENSFPLPFHLLAYIFVLSASFIFKANSVASSLPSDLLPPSYKDTCGYMGPPR